MLALLDDLEEEGEHLVGIDVRKPFVKDQQSELRKLVYQPCLLARCLLAFASGDELWHPYEEGGPAKVAAHVRESGGDEGFPCPCRPVNGDVGAEAEEAAC